MDSFESDDPAGSWAGPRRCATSRPDPPLAMVVDEVGRGGLADEQRRSWVVPSAGGASADLGLHSLDPARADDRYLLILAEHPELRRAVEDDVEEVEVAGVRVNPRLHLAVHELVANQLWNGDPPEVLATALRLRELGYERHDILHMLGSVALEQLCDMVYDGHPYDRGRYVAALAGLPESWERLRSGSSRSGAGRRATRRRGRPRRPSLPDRPRGPRPDC